MNKRPYATYLLVLLLAIQSVGAIYGGLMLVASPSGNTMQMPLSMLDGSPFSTFLIPGIILLTILGLFPGILVFGLLFRPEWKWANVFNVYRGIHWAWTYSLYLGIMLVIWILVEIVWIEYDILQTIFGLVGVILLILTLLPANMRHFGWHSVH